MPTNSTSNFDSLSAMITLLNNDELQALAKNCQKLIEARERLEREGLRQELMGNLQKALSDILHNDFSLIIENTERDRHDDDSVVFDPGDIYSITIA